MSEKSPSCGEGMVALFLITVSIFAGPFFEAWVYRNVAILFQGHMELLSSWTVPSYQEFVFLMLLIPLIRSHAYRKRMTSEGDLWKAVGEDYGRTFLFPLFTWGIVGFFAAIF